MSEKQSEQVQEPSAFMTAGLLLFGAIILFALILLVIVGAKAAYNLMTAAQGTETSREEALRSVEEPHLEAPLSEVSFDSLDSSDIDPSEVTVSDRPLLEDGEVAVPRNGEPPGVSVQEEEENVATALIHDDSAEEVNRPIRSEKQVALGPAPRSVSTRDTRLPNLTKAESIAPDSTEAPSPTPNQALAAQLQSLSPKILEIRFAVADGRRTPRVVLRSDTSEEEALSISIAVLGAFLTRERWTVEETIGTRSGFRGVYVDLPPDSLQSRQTMEPFALRGLNIDGTRAEDRSFGAPYLLSAQEVYERNGVAMCCRNRPVGEVRGREVILR